MLVYMTTHACRPSRGSSQLRSRFVYNGLATFSIRRGNPVRILSDSGTNFVGAERELRESLQKINQKRVADELSARGVQWILTLLLSPGLVELGNL